MSSAPKSWQDSYLDAFYPETSWRRDGTRDFFRLLQENVTGKILEVGAGPSNTTSDYLGTLGELFGIDVSPEVLENQALAEASLFTDEFPFADNTFDSCVSNYVCEHLDDPEKHLSEVWRVLKPSGSYVFRTPNRFHYTAIVSGLTPHSFHLRTANKLRGIEGHDPYPTRYRLNSRSRVKRLASKVGFKLENLRLLEKEPSYGMSSRILFLTFTAYERLINSAAVFAPLRSSLFVVLRKPAEKIELRDT